MKQIEIDYFWPLTEQITLDLDYTPSEQWISEWQRQKQCQSVNYTNGSPITGAITTSSQLFTTSFVVKASTKNVGKWEISDSVFVYRSTKPNALIRHMAKYFFGFKWHDEI